MYIDQQGRVVTKRKAVNIGSCENCIYYEVEDCTPVRPLKQSEFGGQRLVSCATVIFVEVICVRCL